MSTIIRPVRRLLFTLLYGFVALAIAAVTLAMFAGVFERIILVSSGTQNKGIIGNVGGLSRYTPLYTVEYGETTDQRGEFIHTRSIFNGLHAKGSQVDILVKGDYGLIGSRPYNAIIAAMQVAAIVGIPGAFAVQMYRRRRIAQPKK
jgi:hypothetical protein